jgi:hypothetical protein
MTRILGFLSRVVLLGLATACTYSDGDDYYDDDYYDGRYYDDLDPGGVCRDDDPARAWIDVDAPLASEPGEGVGLFIEYQEGGRWHLFTTCDSAASGYECEFNVVVAPLDGASVFGVIPEALERDDVLQINAQDHVRFLARTDLDQDGFYVDADAGAPIEIEFLLDGVCASRYVYWIGEGGIHSGVPSNPFELEPVAP